MEKQIDPGEDFEGALDQITDSVAKALIAFYESIQHLSPLEQERALLHRREGRCAALVEMQAPDFLIARNQRLVEESKARVAKLEAIAQP